MIILQNRPRPKVFSAPPPSSRYCLLECLPPGARMVELFGEIKPTHNQIIWGKIEEFGARVRAKGVGVSLGGRVGVPGG